MKKVLLTATVQSHIVQFHRPLVEILHEAGFEVHVAAKDNLCEKNGLALDFVDKVFDVPFSRSPQSLDNINAYHMLKRIINSEEYEVIHCNTPMGGLITRIAAIKARKNGTKVYYTAHGFHFYKGAPIKNWILFYPIEKVMTCLTDTIITVAKEDYLFAKKHFGTKVYRIHSVGVDPDRYHKLDDNLVEKYRSSLGVFPDDFSILCVGELNENKNQIVLIEAVEMLAGKYPRLKVFLAGNGPKEDFLREKIREKRLENIITMLGYRTDLETITPAIDLLVSCSKREGLALNVIEAMLCQKPVIVSINRGNKELVRNGKNGFVFNPSDSKTLAEEISWIIENKEKREKLGLVGYKVGLHYTFPVVKEELKKVYGLD